MHFLLPKTLPHKIGNEMVNQNPWCTKVFHCPLVHKWDTFHATYGTPLLYIPPFSGQNSIFFGLVNSRIWRITSWQSGTSSINATPPLIFTKVYFIIMGCEKMLIKRLWGIHKPRGQNMLISYSPMFPMSMTVIFFSDDIVLLEWFYRN